MRAGATNVVITLKRQGALAGTMEITGLQTSDDNAYQGSDYVAPDLTSITWNPSQPDSVSIFIPLLDCAGSVTSPKYFFVQATGTLDRTNYVQPTGYSCVSVSLRPAKTNCLARGNFG